MMGQQRLVVKHGQARCHEAEQPRALCHALSPDPEAA